MEKQKVKRWLEYSLAGGVVILLTLMFVTFASASDPDDVYASAIETEKQALDYARSAAANRCGVEKVNAATKLTESLKGDREATSEEQQSWLNKQEWTCDYSEYILKEGF
jgi:hypothetical protein